MDCAGMVTLPNVPKRPHTDFALLCAGSPFVFVFDSFVCYISDSLFHIYMLGSLAQDGKDFKKPRRNPWLVRHFNPFRNMDTIYDRGRCLLSIFHIMRTLMVIPLWKSLPQFFKSDRLKPIVKRGISGYVHRYLVFRKFRGALCFYIYICADLCG